MPEIIWVGLIFAAVWGGAVWFCLGTNTVPFNWGYVFREDNPLLFWILVGLFALAFAVGLALAAYGTWTTYLVPLFS